jgi:putative transposase
MGHTYTNLITHIIFSTKDRIPYLGRDKRNDVFAYMGGIVRELDGIALNINGDADHVHVLIGLPPSLALAEGVRIIKTNSSRWIHEQRIVGQAFAWQSGYAAFQREHV